MSATIIFDSQDYARRLEQAGFTPQQAEILKEHGEHLRAALQPLLRFYEETVHRDLATKGDVMDTRLEIERVRAEVEKVRAETEKVRAELKVDIERLARFLILPLTPTHSKGGRATCRPSFLAFHKK